MSTKTAKNQKLVTCSLVGLIGRNVTGIKAQVRNPIYLGPDMPEQWRTLIAVDTYKEKGKMWVTLHWEREADDSCSFTGCTQESDSCKVQFTHSEFSKMLKQS
jgi:hypothetical protein